jgi:hypothetical protein
LGGLDNVEVDKRDLRAGPGVWFARLFLLLHHAPYLCAAVPVRFSQSWCGPTPGKWLLPQQKLNARLHHLPEGIEFKAMIEQNRRDYCHA